MEENSKYKLNDKKIKLNCKQCRIIRVVLNDFDCEHLYTYSDPLKSICDSDSKRNLDAFSNANQEVVRSVEADRGGGELIILIPDHLHEYVHEGKTLKLRIDFSLEKPQGGVHFVIPNAEGTLAEKGAHLFTYRFENSSRLWFPCIDSYSEPCTWTLEFTVDASMIAISCGDLLETILSPDGKKKTFHYSLQTPTSAPNIGLAVGAFEMMVDPTMHEVTNYCLPHLQSILQDTCTFLHEAFEFYEELLSTNYPYNYYKQVFVDEAYEDTQTYASMTILSTNLLHSRHIIDQTYITRSVLAQSIAEQFFGCFITQQSSSDAWLTRGISLFLAAQYQKKAFGNNEYRHHLYKELEEVISYEQKYGGSALDSSKQRYLDLSSSPFYFSTNYLHTLSPFYNEIHKKKSFLIIRMLEDRLGKELLLQVFNKLLALASTASNQKFSARSWFQMQLSTTTFERAIGTVTGKQIDVFLDQWVYQGGHAKFTGSFVFNRKRNTVELEIRQNDINSTGIRKYVVCCHCFFFN